MSSNEFRVLVIEDELPIRRFLKASLLSEGYRVDEATTGEGGIRTAMATPPDLIILDLGLPGLDGQVVLERLREWFSGPILILSARDQEKQKIEALDHGADDYITKPFGVGELLARMRAALRHSHQVANDVQVVQIYDLRVNLASRQVFKADHEIHLTPLEYKLLITLIKHAGKVLTHRFLLKEVWGPQNTHETHYLRVFVATLRRKIEVDPARPQLILTEQSIGYRFATQ